MSKKQMHKKTLKMTPMMILKRGDYLYHFSFWVYGLYHDMIIAGRSLNGTILNDSESAYPVQSISYMYLVEFVKNVKFEPNDVFVDVGCAWGRLIGYLLKKTDISKFYGVELNEKIASKAKKHFKNKSRVEIISGDILENIPTDATVYYLFNPFSADVLDKFLTLLEEKIDHSVKIFYLYPTCSRVFEKHPAWKMTETVELSPKRMGKLTMFVYHNEGF